VRQRQMAREDQLGAEIGAANDELTLCRLMASGMLSPAQLCKGMEKLVQLVLASADPEGRVQLLVASAELQPVAGKLLLAVPHLDALQLRELVCAMATVKFHDPRLVSSVCETISSCLHSLSSSDIGKVVWAFCTLGLAQAPSYARMMRSIERSVGTFSAELLCQLANAIAPLTRSAACSRLLPKLALALSRCQPPPPFDSLLSTARALCVRVPLPEGLLRHLLGVILSEVSGEGEGPMAGSLSSAQLVDALWVFVRHVPLLAQQARSSLAQQLPPLIIRLLHLLTDLSQVPSDALSHLVLLLARITRSQPPLLQQIGVQVEERLARGGLKLAHLYCIAWGLRELHDALMPSTPVPPLVERLLAEAARRCRAEDIEQLVDALQAVSFISARRPWKLLETLIQELRTKAASLEPKQLVNSIDSIARMRLDDHALLEALEACLDRHLERGVVHEAQAAAALECFGAVQYSGRAGAIVHKLFRRLSEAPFLQPHSLASLLHGAAQLRVAPAAGTDVSFFFGLMQQSALSPDWADWGTILWSLIELDRADVAMEALQAIDAETLEGSPDTHTTCTFLWAVLALRQTSHPLFTRLVNAARQLNAMAMLPSQLCLIMECVLMLKLEAAFLNVALPSEMCTRASAVWQAHQQRPIADHTAITPQLLSVSKCLEALGVRYGLNVFNNYLIDAVIPQEVSGSANLALLLHPPNHYTTARGLVGSVQLRSRLLGKLGFSVVDIPIDMWDGLRGDGAKLHALRELLAPHIKSPENVGRIDPRQ